MRPIDKILNFKMKLAWFGSKEIEVKLIDVLFFIIIANLGVVARMGMYNIASEDYTKAFADWMRECHEAGGFAYLGIMPGVSDASTFDYNVMFQYVIVILHYLRFLGTDIFLVKTTSAIFDFLSAVAVMRIVYQLTSDKRKALFGFAGIMFLPSVVMNSAAWGQNDSIYTYFLLLCLLAVMQKKDAKAWFYFAISFSFKQQAVFFLPVLIILWLKDRIKIRYILIVPVWYVGSMIPAVFAGRDIANLLGMYSKQTTMFSRLTMNYPSIYSVIATDSLSRQMNMLVRPAGIACTVILLGILCYYVYTQKFVITDRYILTLSIMTMLLVCFCLPSMHERYGYIPEVLAVAYAMYGIKKLALCAGIQVITIMTYSRYIFGSYVTKIWPLAMAELVIILILIYDLWQQMQVKEA